MPVGHLQAQRVQQDLQGSQRILEIGQRLPHSHEDHVGQLNRVARQMAFYRAHLVDDFRRAQIPAQADPPGMAETALLGAAHLGGDAQGVMAPLRDQNAFDPFSVFQDP